MSLVYDVICFTEFNIVRSDDIARLPFGVHVTFPPQSTLVLNVGDNFSILFNPKRLQVVRNLLGIVT